MTGKKILIVEDSFFDRRLVEAVLKPHGYRVIEAQDSHTGLEMAAKHQPDLILMDLNLPGTSGYELTKRLKANKQTCQIPVIALTASLLPEDLNQAIEAGCSGHITKPINTRIFPHQIRHFLAGAPATDRAYKE